MKILGRVVYAFIVGIFLLYALNIAESIISAKYFEKYGPDAVINRDDEFFFGGAGFHKKEAITSFSDSGIEIKLYEVTKLFIQKKTEEKKVEEYVYVLIYDDYGTINPTNKEEYFLSLYDQEEDKSYDIAIKRFRDLDIFVAVYLDSNEMSALLPKEAFLSNELTSISILHENESVKEIIVEFPFKISDSDFLIADVLLNHFDDMEEFGVYPKVLHDVLEFRPVLYMTIGIYMGIVIVATYFIYFFNLVKFLSKFKRKDKSSENY